MLETILFWLAIWFNAGLISQLIMSIFDGLVNRRWPFAWDDSKHFLLAGLYGFISVISMFVFFVQFAIDPSQFESEEGEDEEALIIMGLNREEQELVLKFVHDTIVSKRKEEAVKADGEEDVE